MREQSREMAGCYCRLSDDDAQDGMSVSIETQMKILGDYCAEKGLIVHKFYQDDGFTGTNFQRPSFQRMMTDAQNGVINTIVVKDLSRFGRNYVQVGTYMSEVFPRLGVRFIAIGDDVDSARGNLDYDLMIPIKNVFNEYYPADCSRKTRQAFIAKATNGEFIGSQAPYGYRKSKEDKHVLEIDEATAPTVRWIFQMAAYNGYGYNKIARILSEKKVMTPAAYQARQAGRTYQKDPYDWNLTTVFKMFDNPTYLGHLVSGRKSKVSYKSKQVVKKPESEWIVVKNQFPALISEELWNDAHLRLGSRKRESKVGFDNIFAGLLKCDKCGHALGIANAEARGNYYTCNTYKKKGPDKCSSHYIRFDTLSEVVLADVRKVLARVNDDRDGFVKMVLDKMGGSDAVFAYEGEMSALEKRSEELAAKFERLYDDRLNGILSEKKFLELSAKCEAEQDNVAEQLAHLREQVSERADAERDVWRFVTLAAEYGEVTQLDREMLNHLIESIEIGERVYNDGGEFVQKVRVNYRFIGSL